MAHIVKYDTKKLLAGALERGEQVRAIATNENEVSGYVHELLQHKEFITVTNRERSFFAQLSLTSKNKIKVQ